MAWVATAIIGGAVVGGVAQAYAANKASSAQVAASNKAADTTLGMYNTTRGDLAPYRQLGQTASDDLTNRLPFLTSPIVMDQAALEQTPGYKFNVSQGLKATQNSAAARGLGSSGAALKGAAVFGVNTANTLYKDQFDLENTNRTNAFNRLSSLIGTGAGAAAGGGTIGQAAAGQAASAQVGAGNAQAAGINAIGTAVGNVGNAAAGYGLYKGLYGDNFGSSGGAVANNKTGLLPGAFANS